MEPRIWKNMRARVVEVCLGRARRHLDRRPSLRLPDRGGAADDIPQRAGPRSRARRRVPRGRGRRRTARADPRLDLDTGAGRRLLHDHPSVRAAVSPRPGGIVVAGAPLSPDQPVRVGTTGITLGRDHCSGIVRTSCSRSTWMCSTPVISTTSTRPSSLAAAPVRLRRSRPRRIRTRTAPRPCEQRRPAPRPGDRPIRADHHQRSVEDRRPNPPLKPPTRQREMLPVPARPAGTGRGPKSPSDVHRFRAVDHCRR